jgi:hypothetical protein
LHIPRIRNSAAGSRGAKPRVGGPRPYDSGAYPGVTGGGGLLTRWGICGIMARTMGWWGRGEQPASERLTDADNR